MNCPNLKIVIQFVNDLRTDDHLDYDSSVQKLTERKNSFSPVTDHNGGKKPATLLKSLVDSYEEEDGTGDDIDPDVAELLTKRWGKKLNPDKMAKKLWQSISDTQIVLSLSPYG